MLLRPEDHEDERRIARDGEVVRRVMLLADHQPLGIDDVQGRPPTVFDALGRPAGSHPGFVYADRPAPIVTDDTARNVAYDVYDAHASAAWRRPGQQAPTRSANVEDAYREYEEATASAWRQRGPRC